MTPVSEQITTTKVLRIQRVHHRHRTEPNQVGQQKHNRIAVRFLRLLLLFGLRGELINGIESGITTPAI